MLVGLRRVGVARRRRSKCSRVRALIGSRLPIICGYVAALGCSGAPPLRGVVLFTRWKVVMPAASVTVYALPAHNAIDRQLAALCASDSMLTTIGTLEVPLGPVLIQGDGIELDASLGTRALGDGANEEDRAVKIAPWVKRDALVAFRARMDSLLRRTAMASARTTDSGSYQLLLPRPDSIELFAFSKYHDDGALLIWRDRVAGIGTHDLRKPLRQMHEVYCGEP